MISLLWFNTWIIHFPWEQFHFTIDLHLKWSVNRTIIIIVPYRVFVFADVVKKTNDFILWSIEKHESPLYDDVFCIGVTGVFILLLFVMRPHWMRNVWFFFLNSFIHLNKSISFVNFMQMLPIKYGGVVPIKSPIVGSRQFFF